VALESLESRLCLSDVSFGTTITWPAGDNPWSVAVGDFDGDGRADLATANLSGNDVSVLIGDGTGNFGTAPATPVGREVESVAVGDFNGDGRADLATTSQSGYDVSVLIGNGSGGFAAPVHFPTGDAPRSMVVGDFNGDGCVDLAVANQSNSVSVLLNTTTPPTPSVFQFGSATYSVNEGAGIATITVTRTGGTAGGASVQFSTSNGSATAGADYTAVTQTVTFGPGVTSRTVTIPILDDTLTESLQETVHLTIGVPTGGTLGNPSTATLTIVDNEPRLTATGRTLTATKKNTFSGVVASFRSADFSHPTDFTAVIDWGDGSSSAGSILFNTTTGLWDVSGSHSHAKKGTFTLKITIRDANGNTALANSTLNA